MDGISFNKKSLLEKYDSVPQQDSQNLVTSGTVYNYVEATKGTLEGEIDNVTTMISSPFTFKGTSTYANLPASGNVLNDTYYVTDLDPNNPPARAGMCMYSWNGTDWVQSSMSEADYAGVIYQLKNDIADTFDAASTYAVGNVVVYQNDSKLYVCNTTIDTPHAFDPTEWDEIKIVDYVDNIVKVQTTEPGPENKIWLNPDPAVYPNGVQVPTMDDICNIIAPEYGSGTGLYNVGDYVIYNDLMYKCNTEITSAEVFDPTKWDQVSVDEEFISVKDSLSTKLTSADIDSTLSILGKAADSKVVGDAVNNIDNVIFSTNTPTLSFNTGVASISTSTGKIQIINNNKYNYTVVNVSKGETYEISGRCNSASHPIVRFADNKLIQIEKTLYEAQTTYVDEKITVPENATKMYLNKYIVEPYENIFSIKRVYNNIEELTKKTDELEEENVIINNKINSLNAITQTIKIASCNCGTFNHNWDDDFPAGHDYEYYKNEWRKMINDSKFDIFALQDFTQYFDGETIDAQNLLFGGQITDCLNDGHGLVTETRIPITQLTTLEVVGSTTNPFIYNGNQYTSARRFAQKVKLEIANKTIIFYNLHFVPGTTAGYPGAFRQAQYNELISDVSTNNYDYVVFLGDFNAHEISEYNIFISNGYTISNGGYLGEFNTLRNTYADNIITSSNIIIKYYNVPTNYDLSTDHRPSVSELQFC